MPILHVGLSYHNTPVALRERLAAREQDVRASLAGQPALGEVVVLATCNRFEVYAWADASVPAAAEIAAALQRALAGACSPAALDAHLVVLSGEMAVEHLLRVACGLESMVLGEAQVLGQVTRAVEQAHAAGTTGPMLSRLFAAATHAGKRARTETPINRHTTSVSHAGAAFLRQELQAQDIPAARVLIVGAGEMATLAAHALHKSGVAAAGLELAFANRTQPRAGELAGRFGGRAVPWQGLAGALAWADGVLVATAADQPILDEATVSAALDKRGGRPLVVVDIGMPRNVDPEVGNLPGVRLVDIDALRAVVDANVQRRRVATPQVDAIVREEADDFARWLAGRQVAPVITGLRSWAREIAAEELARALGRLPDADPRTHDAVQRMAHRLVNRLLHAPTIQLRSQAADGHAYGYSQAVRALFDLEQESLPCHCEHMPAHLPAGQEAPCTLRCLAPPALALPPDNTLP